MSAVYEARPLKALPKTEGEVLMPHF